MIPDHQLPIHIRHIIKITLPRQGIPRKEPTLGLRFHPVLVAGYLESHDSGVGTSESDHPTQTVSYGQMARFMRSSSIVNGGNMI